MNLHLFNFYRFLFIFISYFLVNKIKLKKRLIGCVINFEKQSTT